jgi:hypothetical protein
MLERPAKFTHDLISEVGEDAVAGFRSQEAAHLDYPPQGEQPNRPNRFSVECDMSEALLRTEFRILIEPEVIQLAVSNLGERIRLQELDRMLSRLEQLQAAPCKLTPLTLDRSGQPREIEKTDSIPFVLPNSTSHDRGALERAAKDCDADAICVLARNREGSEGTIVPILDVSQTVGEAQIFLRGHSVPWDSRRGIVPFSVLYAVSEPVMRRLQSLHTALAQRNDGSPVVETARSLAYNRASSICFTRDRLRFYGIQRRIAARRQPGELHYPMEVGYYLSHYYLLIFGAFDQMCRIAAPLFQTGIDADDLFKIGVRKKAFLNALATSAPDVHDLFTDSQFVEWFTVLSAARHFVAHQGQASSNPMLRKAEVDVSDDDLDRQLNSDGAWRELIETLPPDVAEEARRILRFELRVRTYEQVAEDTMVFTTKNGVVVTRPLANVESDFLTFRRFADNFVDLCLKRLT